MHHLIFFFGHGEFGGQQYLCACLVFDGNCKYYVLTCSLVKNTPRVFILTFCSTQGHVDLVATTIQAGVFASVVDCCVLFIEQLFGLRTRVISTIRCHWISSQNGRERTNNRTVFILEIGTFGNYFWWCLKQLYTEYNIYIINKYCSFTFPGEGT